jgi:hypothetical protein
MQTWLTYVINTDFSFLHIKKIRCDLDPYFALGLITCPNNCTDGDYKVIGNNNVTVCYPCHYTCLTCQNPNSCITCPSTRIIDPTNITLYCVCLVGYYDSGTNQCIKCDSQCIACSQPKVCTSCDANLFRFLNPISQYCDCKYGYIQGANSQQCSACVVGCSNCSSTI